MPADGHKCDMSLCVVPSDVTLLRVAQAELALIIIIIDKLFYHLNLNEFIWINSDKSEC